MSFEEAEKHCGGKFASRILLAVLDFLVQRVHCRLDFGCVPSSCVPFLIHQHRCLDTHNIPLVSVNDIATDHDRFTHDSAVRHDRVFLFFHPIRFSCVFFLDVGGHFKESAWNHTLGGLLGAQLSAILARALGRIA
jgi:hypothetical protein